MIKLDEAAEVDEAYRLMAEDEVREVEAFEWAEATIKDWGLFWQATG